jgi:putative flippase GtrA
MVGSISIISIVKFGLVGACNTLLSLSIIFLSKAMGIGDVLANLTGYVFGLLLSFQLNKNWTFCFSKNRQAWLFIRFLAAFAVAWAVNAAVLRYLLTTVGLNSYLAQLGSMPVYTIVFYLLSALFVFRT